MLESFKGNTVQPGTRKTYHCVWQNFNKFIVRLDRIPAQWEERASLYCAFLIWKGKKSSTLKSYVSAIKHKLLLDGYQWNDKLLLLTALTRACKLDNDTVKSRLPIGDGFLNVIIFELQRYLRKNEYKKAMYRTLLLTGYFGLFRIGELAQSEHSIKACDVHTSDNRDKVLIVLHSSKTHSRANKPKKIEITNDRKNKPHFFCPVQELNNYSQLRIPYVSCLDQFFVHQDGSPVTPAEVRNLLRQIITNLGLDAGLYDTHSLRIGRATDLFKKGISIDQIKKIGRWQSNAVYRYLK